MSIRTTRSTALAGLAFVLYVLGEVFAAPSTGEPGDSGAQVLGHLTAHPTAIEVWAVLSAGAAIALLVFAFGLTEGRDRNRTLRRARYGAVTGIILAVGTHVLTGALAAVASAGGLSAGSASILNHAVYDLAALVRLGFALFVGGTTLAMRGTADGRGVRRIGAASAVLNLISVACVASSGPLSASSPVAALAMLTMLIWIGAMAVRLLRQPDTSAAGIRLTATEPAGRPPAR